MEKGQWTRDRGQGAVHSEGDRGQATGDSGQWRRTVDRGQGGRGQ
jgi:hypothetical protein